MICLISCPSDRDRLHSVTVESVANMQNWLRESGHTCQLAISPYPEIVEARNVNATVFMNSEAELMISIDNGVGVSREAFDRMLSSELDHVAAHVPVRPLNLDKFAEAVRAGKSDEEAERAAGSAEEGEAGISEVETADSSFFMIRRGIAQKIVDGGLAATKVSVTALGNTERLGFFDEEPTGQGVARMSAHESFCNRIRSAGGAVHVSRGPGVSHVSDIVFAS